LLASKHTRRIGEMLQLFLDISLVYIKVYMELVASFHECQHGSPWPYCMPRAVAAYGAVRKIRGTPRQRVGWNTHHHCMFCLCTPEMYEPHRHAFSPHISRGYTDQQNSQPVTGDRVRSDQRPEGMGAETIRKDNASAREKR